MRSDMHAFVLCVQFFRVSSCCVAPDRQCVHYFHVLYLFYMSIVVVYLCNKNSFL